MEGPSSIPGQGEFFFSLCFDKTVVIDLFFNTLMDSHPSIKGLGNSVGKALGF